jgi:hypothetical protein
MSDTEKEQPQESKSKGGRPRLASPPTTSAEVRVLMAQELVKSAPDRFKIQGLTKLLDTFEAQEERAAATTLVAKVDLDAANTRIAELEGIAVKVPGLEAELAELKFNFDTRLSEARVELTGEAAQKLSLAERVERQATNLLQDAERKFSQSGLESLMDAMRGIVSEYKIPAPDMWSLPTNTNPLLLTLWPDEWPIRRATLWCAFRKGWTADTPGFREAALRVFIAALPAYGQSASAYDDAVSDLPIRVECFTELCRKFNCLDVIQRQVDQVHAARYGEHRQRQLANLASQEIENAKHGAGRISIQAEEPASSVPLSEHVFGCCCKACGGSGLPSHLREDLSLGTSTPRIEQDMNEPRPLTYGENE